MSSDVVGEVLEAELAGLYQVSDEADGVLEDRFDGGAEFLEVGDSAGSDDLEDNLQQVEHGAQRPTEEPSGKIAEQLYYLADKAGQDQDVADRERFQEIEEEAGDLSDKSEELFEGSLEPGPNAGEGVGLLDVGPQLILMNELHESA